MTLALPDDLRREMDAHPEIRWAEIARRAIQKELERMHLHDRLLAGSRLTEEDAVEIGKKVRRAARLRRT
jgi:hypothetical protein